MTKVDRRWIPGALAMAWVLASPGVVFANADLERAIAEPKNWAM